MIKREIDFENIDIKEIIKKAFKFCVDTSFDDQIVPRVNKIWRRSMTSPEFCRKSMTSPEFFRKNRDSLYPR